MNEPINITRPAGSRESLWQILVKPRGALFEPDLRDQSRFLRTMALVLGPLMLIADALVHLMVRRNVRYTWLDLILLVSVLMLVLVPYLLKRISYRSVALLFIANLIITVAIIGIGSYHMDISIRPTPDADFFVYMTLPLFLSGALLPLGDTLLLSLGVAAFEIMLPFLMPQISFRDIGPSLIFLIFAVPILAFVTKYREKLEHLKTATLRESEERYRNLADLLPLSVFEADTAGKLTFANQAALTCFGYNADDLRSGMGLGQMVTAEDRSRLAEAVMRIIQGEEQPEFEYAGLRKNGTSFPVKGYTSRIMKDGRPIGVRGVAIDVTERKETEQRLERMLSALTQSNQELEQFAYVASHDLQEPLRMVSSYLQLLEKRYAPGLQGEAKEFMDFAIDGASRMQGLIRDLLAYSRINTQAEPFKATSMQKVYETALANLRQAAMENKATITCEPLPEIKGHESQLVQLLQNLIANAIKFHGQEAPVVHVGVKDAGKFWEFSVNDNGIGIDPQYNERIFMIFKKLHSREKYAGSGIGLAVCKRIVERHGGSIRVESQPGKGSNFIFTLAKGE